MSTTLLVAEGIHTLADDTPPGARAIVINADRILWVGADPADAPRHDRVVDLGGAWITPAMVDAHVHATGTGLALNGVTLAGSESLAEAMERLRTYAERHPQGVIHAVGWDDFGWPEGRKPTAADIDEAVGGRTVRASRVDGHSCVVDPQTLASLDLSDVEGVDRDAQGQPTGYLREAASERAQQAMVTLRSEAEYQAARRAVCAHAASLGIGAFHEMGHPGLSHLSDALAWSQGQWPLDVHVWWADFGPWVPGWDRSASQGLDAQQAAEAGLRPGGDLFLDGSIGSHTAAVDPPYVDNGEAGDLFWPDEAVRSFFSVTTAGGVGAAVHAIGERGIAQAAWALAAAAEEHGVDAVRRARHRVEHVELPKTQDLETLGRLGVIASVQPVFDALWGGNDQLYAGRFGVERSRASNPFDRMLQLQIPLAFGSDSTVTPMGPVEAMHAGIHHLGGRGVAPVQALRAHTLGGRYAAGQDATGPLAQGRRADFAIWDRDPIDQPHRRITSVSCLATVVRGERIHGSW